MKSIIAIIFIIFALVSSTNKACAVEPLSCKEVCHQDFTACDKAAVNDEGKETLAADGSKILLEPRSGSGVQSQESVADAVLRNIAKRKFISVLTFVGKLNYFMQPIVPQIVERIILKNIHKFEERSK